MSGRQGRMSGTPPRRLPRRSHSPLTACPGPRRAGHGRWRVGTRLRRVLLRWQAPQPWRSRPGTTPAEAVDPTLVGTLVPTRDPTPPTRVPPRLLGDPSPLVMPPRGVERALGKVRFARLIHSGARVFGGPSARAACGGNLSPARSLLRRWRLLALVGLRRMDQRT